MSTLSRSLFLGAALLTTALVCSAGPITYYVNLNDGSGDSVVGTITTDGTIGSLAASNVEDWNLVLTALDLPSPAVFDLEGPLSGDNSILGVSGSDFVATATGLFLDSGADNTFFDFLAEGGSAPEAAFIGCDGGYPGPPCFGSLFGYSILWLVWNPGPAGPILTLSPGAYQIASTMPEPSSLALLLLGSAGLIAKLRRRK